MTRHFGWRPSRQLAAALCAPLAGLLTACQPPAERAAPAAAAAPHAGAMDPRMASDLDRAAERGNMCSAREAKAAGLTAEYFGAKGFKGAPLLTRQEGPIDADWPVVGKDVKSPVRSARWRGWIRPPFTGAFGFHVDMPGAQISIAGKRLTPADDKMHLYAGRYHPFQIELPELPAPAKGSAASYPPLRLSWTTPFGARYLVSKAVLFPPSDTVDRSAASPKSEAQKPGS